MTSFHSLHFTVKRRALLESPAFEWVFGTELPRLGVSPEGARQVMAGEVVSGLGDRMAIARIVRQGSTNGSTVYISSAGGGVWKTKDGGNTWLPLFDASSPSAGFDSRPGSGVLKSMDGGQTWLTPLGTQQLLAGLPVTGEGDRNVFAIWLTVGLIDAAAAEGRPVPGSVYHFTRDGNATGI